METDLWRAVGKHANCVQLYQTYCDDNLFYMVMEQCACSLETSLTSLWQASESSLVSIFRQTLLGLAHVHSAHVVHRDLKPGNIFLGGPNGSNVKIGDFGVSALLLPGSKALSGACGTLPYMSPEMVSMKGHRHSTDLWSLGVMVYQLLFGEYPFNPPGGDAGSLRLAILCGAPAPKYMPVEVVQRSTPVSVLALRFSQALLTPKPLQRPTAREMLQHPFLLRWAADGKSQRAPPAAAAQARQQDVLACRTSGCRDRSGYRRCWPQSRCLRATAPAPLADQPECS